MSRSFLVALLFLLLAGSAWAWPTDFDELVIASQVGWDQPVNVEFSPDGRIFVGERRGVIWVLEPDPGATDPRTDYLRDPTPFLDLQSVVLNHWDRGLLDFALDPDFANNGYVYVAYVVETDPGSPDQYQFAYSRLERYTVSAGDPNVLDPASQFILVGETWPLAMTSAHFSHSTGTILFGDDGTLLYSHGDGAHFDVYIDAGGLDPDQFLPGRSNADEDVGSFRSQYLGTLSGKVLRLDPATGDGIPSNPFYNAGDPRADESRIWAYGLRNPYRMNIMRGSGSTDPADGDPGTLFIADVGFSRWEEISICTGGENFGWPCYEGAENHTGYQGANPMHSDCPPDNSGMVAPLIYWPHPSVSGSSIPVPGMVGNAATGVAWHTQLNYPSPYRRGLFFCDFSRAWINFAQFDDDDQLVDIYFLHANANAPVDLQIEPNSGDLVYVSYDSQELRRVVYDGPTGAGTPPTAPSGLAASAASGQVMVDWLDNPELDIAGYNIYRSESATGPWTQLNTSLVSFSNFLDDGSAQILVNGQLYYYVVEAIDLEQPAMTSALSTPVPAIPSAKWWEFYVPAPGPTLTIQEQPAPFPRVVTIPQLSSGDFDHWSTNNRAPLMRRVPPAADWTLSTHLSLDSFLVGRNFQTGLMVQFGVYDLFAFGPFQGTDLRVERSGQSNLASLAQSATEMELRIVKTGNQYSFEYREFDTDPWTVVGTETATEPVLHIGAITKTWQAAAPLTIRYQSLGVNELPPVAASASDIANGPTPLAVQFDADGSFDPDGDILTHHWDFGDGNQSTEPDPLHSYTLPGQYQAVLTVRDNAGLETSAPALMIEAEGNHPPTVAIVDPLDGTEYIDAGLPIAVAANGNDPEDGGALLFDWSVDLIHGGVRTPGYLNPPDGANSSFIPNTVDDGQGIVLEVICTVTDSGALSARDTVRVYDRVLPPAAVVDLRASQADGASPYAAGSTTSPWVDLAGGHDFALAGFAAPSGISGWQGSGILGDPYRLEFDGVDDRATVAAGSVLPLIGNAAASCELWLRTGSDVDSRQYVLEWLDAFAPPFDGMTIALANGRLEAYLGSWTDLGPVFADRWHQLILSKSTSGWQCWLDGAPAASGVAAHLGDANSEIVLGAGTFAGAGIYADHLRGALGELRLYDFELTPANVTVLYALGEPVHRNAPQALALTPSSAANDAVLTGALLDGLDIADGASVVLSMVGESDLVASNVQRIDPTQLSFDVDLTGAALGAWDLTLTNPDGLSSLLPAALTVAEPSPLFVELDARKADALAPPAVPGAASPWIDATGGHAFALSGFAGDATSGWVGDGTGKNPYGLRFDGVDDRVTIAAGTIADLVAPTELTVEMWLRLGSDVSTTQTILEWTQGYGAPYAGMSLIVEDGDLYMRFDDALDTEILGSVFGGEWTYCAITQDANGTIGVRFNATTFTRPGVGPAPQLSELVLGASTRLGAGIYSEPFGGEIAVLRMHRTALDVGTLGAVYLAELSSYRPEPEALIRAVPSASDLAASAPLDAAIEFDSGELTQSMRGLSLTLDYDPAAFDYVGCSDSGWLAGFGNVFFDAQLVTPGQLRIDASLLGITGGAIGAGTLATVQFTTRADAVEGASLLDLSVASAVDLANPPAQLPRTVVDASVDVDRTPPIPLSNLAAAPLPAGGMALSWDLPAADYDSALVFWKPWEDAAPHGYPEYDDAVAAPAWPIDMAEAQASWNQTIVGGAGTSLAFGARTAISALVVARDAAGNVGDFATAARLRAPNYLLGDLGSLDAGGAYVLGFDGTVDPFNDLPVLSLVYGATSADPEYLPQVDIGPTADGTPQGIPQTDDVIDFEDLMIFAQDFPSVSAKPMRLALGARASGDHGLRLLSSESESPSERAGVRAIELTLSLAGNVDGIKGLNLELGFDDARLRYAGLRRSAALARADAAVVHFAREVESGLVLDLAVLGRGAELAGDGDLLTLRFDVLSELGGAIELRALSARSADGAAMAIDGSGVAKEQLAALPQVVALLPNSPNPFNPRTTIRFELPAEQKVQLSIYDLSGRRVRTLLSGPLAGGYHHVDWEGDDDRGASVASGVYLYELRAEGQRLVKKMLLVK